MADTLLLTQKSSKNQDINIFTTDDLKSSKCLDFFMNEYTALVKAGAVLEKFLNQVNRHSAIFAEIDGEIVGVIAYKLQSKTAAWMTVAVVDAINRKDGIYTMLYDSFEKQMVSAGVTSVNTLVDTSNSAMLTVLEKSGYETKFFRVSKKIGDANS